MLGDSRFHKYNLMFEETILSAQKREVHDKEPHQVKSET